VDLIERASKSGVVKLILTLIVYAFYACVLGLSLAPAVLLMLRAFASWISPAILAGESPAALPILLFSLSLGAAAFVFYFFGLLVMGCIIRLFSLGIKPGRHDAASLTVLLWMILNGVFTLAWRIILPIVPMTLLSMMFHRLCGCRIGKNVWINTLNLVDSYMISIGDNTIIGGEAVLSPHIFEGGKLIIERITIGRDCLIGGHAYISPGVAIGDRSVIGMKVWVRKGRQVPPGSRLTTVAGLPFSKALDLERAAIRRPRSPAGS
jgi:hypothetical protein